MPKAETKPAVSTPTQRQGANYYANGKRKSAIARVRLYVDGKGDISINGNSIDDYFFGTLIGNAKSPLKLTNTLKHFDIIAYVQGGGISAQSDAVRHAISKGLLAYDPALRPDLKRAGFLTRDARVKERKKFGLKRARRAPQWSKR